MNPESNKLRLELMIRCLRYTVEELRNKYKIKKSEYSKIFNKNFKKAVDFENEYGD